MLANNNYYNHVNNPVNSSVYSDILSRIVDPVNLTAGMSYASKLNYEMNNSNNLLEIPAPSNQAFNASFANITMGNIKVPNFNPYLQTYNERGQLLIEANRPATSFTVPSNCHLTNASFYFNIFAGDPVFSVRLHNSTWNDTLGINQPYGNPFVPNDYKTINISTPGVSGAGWVNFTFTISPDTYLNSSKTDNNTWYICLVVGSGSVEWNYELDGENEDDDNSLSYEFSFPNWYLTEDSGDIVDYAAKLGFKRIELTIKPSDIGLKINGFAVKDVNNPIYTGQWISTRILTPKPDGKLILDVTADYWGVCWTIYNISVKYTKTDIKATTNFTIQLGSIVTWEVNRAVEVFNINFSDFILNFTISDTWTISNCYNISSADPHTFLEWDKPGPYKEISIDDAGNSSNWRLFCTSINFADSISILVDGINSTTVHYFDDLQFVAGFNGKITGDVNLTVYSSSGFINYTTVYSSISEVNEVAFPSFDLSENISEYGNYIIQYYWFNATHVAYLEEGIIILANTQLSLISPPQNTEFDPSDTFRITVYYDDIGLNIPINDATINYEINGSGTQVVSTNNGTSGYYEILINCSTLGTGQKTVDINAIKTLYQGQSLTYNFYISSSQTGGGITISLGMMTILIAANIGVIGIILHIKKKGRLTVE